MGASPPETPGRQDSRVPGPARPQRTLPSCACGTSVAKGSARSSAWPGTGRAGRRPVSPRSGPASRTARAPWNSSTSTPRRNRCCWLRAEGGVSGGPAGGVCVSAPSLRLPSLGGARPRPHPGPQPPAPAPRRRRGHTARDAELGLESGFFLITLQTRSGVCGGSVQWFAKGPHSKERQHGGDACNHDRISTQYSHKNPSISVIKR